MKRKLLIIASVSIIIGLLFDVFIYGHIPGLGVFLFVLSILGGTAYLAYKLKRRLNPVVYVLAALAAFFSLMVFVRANEFLIFLNIITVLYLLLLIAESLRLPQKSLFKKLPNEYGRVFGLPFQFISSFVEVTKQALSSGGESAGKRNVLPVVRGLVIGLPFIIIFVLLFSSADAVFNHYVTSIFSFDISASLVFRLQLILIVTALFVGAFGWIFLKTGAATEIKAGKKQFSLGITEAGIVLGSVAVLFMLFVLIQLAYLFGGQEVISSTGYTYAEYARKGFFELVLVAILSFGLLWFASTSTKRANLKQTVFFMWVSGVIIAEVMIIMLSAHRRLNLYEEAYGFTEGRLYGHLIIGWLAVVFILLMVYLFREETRATFAARMSMSVLAFLAITNLLNPHAFIAQKNIDRFNQTKRLDVRYLTTLSADATPTLSQLLNSNNEELKHSLAADLYFQRQRLIVNTAEWQSANLSRTHAKNALDDHQLLLEGSESYMRPADPNRSPDKW